MSEPIDLLELLKRFENQLKGDPGERRRAFLLEIADQFSRDTQITKESRQRARELARKVRPIPD